MVGPTDRDGDISVASHLNLLERRQKFKAVDC